MEYDTEMAKYKDFAPTCFDQQGYMLENRQDWYVLPVGRNRDSGILTESNFQTATEILGGERTNIMEIHRFGHWGIGWFEIIIVNPRAGKTMRKAINIEENLADYPILDESDWSAREWGAMEEGWLNMPLSERMEVCCETNNSIFAARHDSIPENVYAEHLGID